MDDLDFLVSNKVSGVYRALVVNDKDPKRLGRIQIRIPALHGIPLVSGSYVPDTELPWAQPASMLGLGVNEGQLIIPKPGMTAFIIFEADNIKNPLYIGTAALSSNAYPIGTKEKNSDAKLSGLYDEDGNVIKDIVYRSSTGKTIYADRLTGDLHVDVDMPVVNDGTLDFKVNGTSIGTFSANSSEDKEFDITIPSVNDAKLTFKVNGTSIGDFTANSAEDKEFDISIPTVNNAKLTLQLNGSNVDDFTANASSDKTINIKALPNYNLALSYVSGGGTQPNKFLSINYSNYTSESAAYFRLSAASCHGNGVSYQFLEDIIIGCSMTGTVTCKVLKYCQLSCSYDGTRNYGDIFYVIDTDNKVVDFYILCGQYAHSYYTPLTKIGNTTTSGITQYTGTPTKYSSGTRVYADGNSTLISAVAASASGSSTTQISYLTINGVEYKIAGASAITSIDGLSGGSLTSPLVIKGGDAVTAAKIALSRAEAGQITDENTSTLFGFLSAGANILTVGSNSYGLNLRGNTTRPQYKGNDLALLSDVETINPTLLTQGTFNSSGAFTIDMTQVTLSEGLYFFTYGNAQAFCWITAAMIQNSGTSPIRAVMPVIYGSSGQSQPGHLRISLASSTSLQVMVANENHHVYQGFVMYIYKAL